MREGDRLREMDGVRAVACLIVVVLHTVQMTFGQLDIGFGPLLPGIPKIGVWLFFVLSAFLLTTQLDRADVGIRDLLIYASNRVLRIMPLFILAVFVYRWAGPFGVGIDTNADIWRALTFQQGYGHLWTIPPEFKFYFVLPAIVFSGRLAASAGGGIGLLAFAIAVAAGCLWAWPPWTAPENAVELGYYLVCFLSGSIVALIAARLPLTPRQWFTISAISLVITSAFVVAAKLDAFGTAPRYLMDKHYVLGPLLALFVAGVSRSAGAWKGVIGGRSLRLIGRSSYSIYLFHWGLGLWCARMMPAALALPIAIAASLIVGIASHFAIERPLYRMRDLFSGPR